MQEIKDWSSYVRSKRDNTGYLSFEQECFLISLLNGRHREKALEEIINCHISIVHNLAKNYKWCSIPYEDLVQYGIAGLISAADKFDISKGNKFSTYAHHYVLGRIKRSLEYYNHLIRKPAHINMAETKLNIFDIEQEVTEEDLKKLVTDRFSLNTLKNAWITKKIKIVDLSDFESEQVQDVDNTDVKIAINQMLAVLNDREKKCIELRFGLNGLDQHQYNDIDKIVGCDSEQVISYAFKKLRKSDKILEYMDILKWIH
jgi:RNA polymerase primary sigma factor